MTDHRAAHLPHDWYDRPLPPNVRLAPGSWLYSSYAFLHYRSRRPLGVAIGASSGVYDGSFFDLGPRGEVRIGHHCTLVGVILCSDGRIEIGDYALLAHRVVLADAAVALPGGQPLGPHRAMPSTRAGAPPALSDSGAAPRSLTGAAPRMDSGAEPRSDPGAEPRIRIGCNAWIGCGAILLAGADIGADAIVGARAVVDGPVPAGMLAVGHPYRLRARPARRAD